MRRFALFALVGGSGVVVNLFVLTLLLRVNAGRRAGIEMVYEVVAAQAAIAWNFVLSARWVFKPTAGHWIPRILSFWLLGTATLTMQLPLTAAVVSGVHVSYLSATVVTLLGLAALRFVVCDGLLFAPCLGRSTSTSDARIVRPAQPHQPAMLTRRDGHHDRRRPHAESRVGVS